MKKYVLPILFLLMAGCASPVVNRSEIFRGYYMGVKGDYHHYFVEELETVFWKEVRVPRSSTDDGPGMPYTKDKKKWRKAHPLMVERDPNVLTPELRKQYQGKALKVLNDPAAWKSCGSTRPNEMKLNPNRPPYTYESDADAVVWPPDAPVPPEKLIYVNIPVEHIDVEGYGIPQVQVVFAHETGEIVAIGAAYIIE